MTPATITAPIPTAPPVAEHSALVMPANTTTPIPAATPVEEYTA